MTHSWVYPKELKTDVQPKICTQIFIAALIIIAKGKNNSIVQKLVSG